MKHNKKRNTGLLYEWLIRYMASAVVEQDNSKKKTVLKILRKHFKPGTELYREFRLFNALAATTVSSDSVAQNILAEAKRAAKNYDSKQLDYEKSLLIKSINHKLNDNAFYGQFVENYKEYATIQSLLNEWREDLNGSIVKVAEYEDKLINWLLSEKNSNSKLEESSQDFADPLVLKLMTKKINEKYSHLNEDSKEIIRNYVFSTDVNLAEKLKEIKELTLTKIDEYLNREENRKDAYHRNKIEQVKKKIQEQDVSNVSDELIERFLDILKLKEELVQD